MTHRAVGSLPGKSSFRCPVCGGGFGLPLLRIPPAFFGARWGHLARDGLRQAYCVRCGAVVNRAVRRISESFYAADYKREFDDEAALLADRAIRESKARDTADYLEERIAGRKGVMLDVGAHYGSVVREMRDRAWEARGIEPAGILCDIGRRLYGVEIDEGYYHPNSYAPATFDLILMENVLEHLEDPGAALRAARTHLRENGRLCVTVPVLDTIRPNQIGGWHLSILSAAGWRGFLARCGLQEVHFALDGLGGGDDSRLRFLARSARGAAAPVEEGALAGYARTLAAVWRVAWRSRGRWGGRGPAGGP